MQFSVQQVLDGLTDIARVILARSSILANANFEIIVTLLIAEWIFSFVCKSQLSTGLTVPAYTSHYKGKAM